LSVYKQFEHKSPDVIKERVEKDHEPLLRTSLTSISKVNKTDVETLRTSFGSFANIARASTEHLQNLPGFGPVKVKNIKNAFEKPVQTKAMDVLGETNEPQNPQTPNYEPGREISPVWDIELDDNPLPATGL